MKSVKVVMISYSSSGSVGGIMRNLSRLLEKNGIETHIAYAFKPRISDSDYIMGTLNERRIHQAFAYLTGFEGCFSIFNTIRFIKYLKTIKPDIIHINNLHGYYINIPLLFQFIKKNDIKVVWTMHDCWAFTGHCPHYEKEGCQKWKTGCYKCERHLIYPKSYPDNSKVMYKLKKRWFLGVNDLTIVAPSRWLANQLTQSFLNVYPIKIINNGIDLNVFKPYPKYNLKGHDLSNKFVIIGVSSVWNYTKGLDVFSELSKRLDDNFFQIIIVGTNEDIEDKIPSSIICIRKTSNQTELAKLYSLADVFVNPTREDTFPTVNIESLACGTPVITFKTGGSPEIIDESCGSVVEKNDIDDLVKEIEKLRLHNFSQDACRKRAQLFDMNKRLKKYFDVYGIEMN